LNANDFDHIKLCEKTQHNVEERKLQSIIEEKISNKENMESEYDVEDGSETDDDEDIGDNDEEDEEEKDEEEDESESELNSDKN